jgi:hypothetical protein
VKLYTLIDAVVRLRIDNLNDLIRAKIKEGNFSRSAQDISSCLYFLATNAKLNSHSEDIELFKNLLRDLKHMQVSNLKIDELNMLVRAFAKSVDFADKLDHPNDTKLIEEFIPKMVEQTTHEIFTCKIVDIITILESYYKLWNKNFF